MIGPIRDHSAKLRIEFRDDRFRSGMAAPDHKIQRTRDQRPQTDLYAHYEAGMPFYEAKRVDRMAVDVEHFLELAPDAPERPAVQSIMRTMRGR